jgi:hypothetical protein
VLQQQRQALRERLLQLALQQVRVPQPQVRLL